MKKESKQKRRSDRDFRKQSVMTFRTLLLDQLLSMFFGILMAGRSENVSMDRLLELFKRSGAYAEQTEKHIYWIDAKGMSKSNRKLLQELIGRLNELELIKQGKPVQVRLREGSG